MSRPAASSRAHHLGDDLWASSAAVIEETAPTAPPSGSGSDRVAVRGAVVEDDVGDVDRASRPIGWREVDAGLCSTEVMAIRSCPCSLTSRASSTTEPFTPEFEAITNMSSGLTGARS